MIALSPTLILRRPLVHTGTAEVPRTVAFAVWPTEDEFGPGWVQFEVDKLFIARLEEVARIMKVGEPRPSASLLGVAAVELNLDARWRGAQNRHAELAEQIDVRPARLRLEACGFLDVPDDLRLFVTGRLASGSELEAHGGLCLQELKRLHAERPPGELLVLDTSGVVNETLDGQQLLELIQEADQIDAATDNPIEPMIG